MTADLENFSHSLKKHGKNIVKSNKKKEAGQVIIVKLDSFQIKKN